MRKVRIDEKAGAHGRTYQYVKWWEPGSHGTKGRERSRCFSGPKAKKLAQGFAGRKFAQLNSDIVVDPVRLDWPTLIDLYEDHYRVRGQTDEARYQAVNSLNHFARLVGTPDSTLITQQHLDQFLIARQKEVRPFTVNKDVANLRAFLAWGKEAGYIRGRFRLEKVPATAPLIVAKTVDEIRRLLAACPTEDWRLRILLSLSTGLRAETIDALQTSHIDLAQMLLHGPIEVKTRKRVLGHPLPDALRSMLARHLAAVGPGPLFRDRNLRREWEKLRDAAGVDCTRQELRRTYNSLMNITESLAVGQAALRHSSRHVNLTFYTDRMLLLRHRVNQLPVAEWLGKEPKRKAKS